MNNIAFSIDTLQNSKHIKDIYNELAENSAIPGMSFLNGSPPSDPYRTPWGPSALSYWYFYLPYADTLNISLNNSVEINKSELKELYLDKGLYKLTANSKDADPLYGSSIYRLCLSFCDTSFNRSILILK
jgi:hypothetical protein